MPRSFAAQAARMPHQRMLGHVLAHDQEATQVATMFRDPKVGCRIHAVVRRILEGITLHELEHLVLGGAQGFVRRLCAQDKARP